MTPLYWARYLFLAALFATAAYLVFTHYAERR